MTSAHRMLAPGPFRAEHIREGDPYELSNGHPILCMPIGQRGGRANLTGGGVLETDPAVIAAGVDIGFSDNPSHLRAPDVSVGDIPNEPGWASKAPRLAVEYADCDQNEDDLQSKIRELQGAGTRFIWVVRLVGPRRVEVHEKGKPMRKVLAGEELIAPGILQNPVPVDAFYDREVAHEAMLRNLLQRKGYASVEAVKAEGIAEGKAQEIAEGITEGKAQGITEGKAQGIAEGIAKGALEARKTGLVMLLTARELPITDAQRKAIEACTELAQVDAWFVRAAVAKSTEEALGSTAPAKPRGARRKG